MLLRTVASIFVFSSSVVYAQTTSSTASSTISAAAATHTVNVGEDGTTFSPPETYAKVGDIIEYRFFPLNHSVARAAFGATPCIPIERTVDPSARGFWSGFRPVNGHTESPPIFRVKINDTNPVFFYCSAPGACQEGMVGVINPNQKQTYAAQFDFALNTTEAFSPDESAATTTYARTTTDVRPTTSPTSSPTTSTTAPPAVTTTTAPPPASSSKELGPGPIAGIAIGGFAALVLAAALIYMCGRNANRQPATPSAPSNHNSYQSTPLGGSAGMREANYPNKTPMSDGGRFSTPGGYGPETESYRSLSPPPGVDERAAMMGGMHFQQGQQGQGSPGLNNGGMGMVSPNIPSPGYASPTYYDPHTGLPMQHHEMENRAGTGMGVMGMGMVPAGYRPYQPVPTHPNATHQGPHELAGGGDVPPESRPFSYTDSEAGFQSERKH